MLSAICSATSTRPSVEPTSATQLLPTGTAWSPSSRQSKPVHRPEGRSALTSVPVDKPLAQRAGSDTDKAIRLSCVASRSVTATRRVVPDRPGHSGRRILLSSRAVRLRQDDNAEHHRRIRRTVRRHRSNRRHRCDQTSAQPAPGQHGVPVLRIVPASERHRERVLRPADGPGAQGRTAQAGKGSLELVGLGTFAERPVSHFPAARPSALPSLARWSTSPACCCSTSRLVRWT